MKIQPWTALVLALCTLGANDCSNHDSDSVQGEQQERMLAEGTSQVGMPAITHFRERKLLKDILELRDQANVVTYTYLFAEMTGKLQFFCTSVGYGIPYATQFTNPQKIAARMNGYVTLPQSDPNGLFSPASADGTWVMCKDPTRDDVKPVYVEPKIIVSPFLLP